MHFSIKALPYITLLLSHHAQATPIAQGGAIATPADSTYCPPHESYTITDQHSFSGEPQQLSTSCTPEGGAPCTVGKEQSYSVAVTRTVGANLDLSEIVGAGVSVEVSITDEKGTTDTAGIECTGPWTCSVIVTPELHQVKGEKTETPCNESASPSTSPYDVTFPLKRGDKLPVVNVTPCACPDYLHWADEGAPEKCPVDCGGN